MVLCEGTLASPSSALRTAIVAQVRAVAGANIIGVEVNKTDARRVLLEVLGAW